MSSGLRKQKKYDWKDSNLALFGSDTEKEVKKEAALTEPAWEGAGQEVGLQIWRIEQFEVKHWPKEEYGDFFSGDSYIILNTYKEDPDSEALSYDVHFWIGKYSSQDEYGTAAYKTVELDTLLDDRAVQHREVQSNESDKFKSYFESITIREGGCATGFRHVEPTEYIPRLLRFNGKRKNITISEVPCARARLSSDDVFIYDGGLQIYQWNGNGANKDERFKAAQYVSKLKSDRNADSEVLDEDGISDSHSFYDLLNDEDDEDDDEVDTSGLRELYKISDADGSVGMELVKEGEFGSDDLTSEDVFLVDVGYHCFVYVGSAASSSEKRNAMSYAHTHLQKSSHPCAPVSIVAENQHNSEFQEALAA